MNFIDLNHNWLGEGAKHQSIFSMIEILYDDKGLLVWIDQEFVTPFASDEFILWPGTCKKNVISFFAFQPIGGVVPDQQIITLPSRSIFDHA